MKTCLFCKQNEIKPIFSFYCRFCYNYLQNKYSLDVIDYITYFQIMYNITFTVKDRSFNNLHAIHNHFQNKLRVTDKPLAELLEIVTFLKFHALSWK